MKSIYRSSKLQKKTMCAAVAIACGILSSSVLAGDTVDYVDVTSGDGIFVNDGKIYVAPVNGVYANVTSGNTVSFHRRLKAGCKGNNVLKNTFISYGIENVSGGILEASNNYRAGIPHQHAGSIGWTQAAMDVPLNKLGFDPVQVCKDMLANKMQQGLTKMQVMNSDQTVNLNASFTGVAACGKLGSGSPYFERDVIGGSVKVICKAGSSGMVNQIAKPKGPITAVPLGGSGNIQAGHQPLAITQGQITTNKLHDSGTCPANLQFGVGFKGHGKGHVRYTITQGGFGIYTSPSIPYNGSEGFKQHHFNYVMNLDPEKTWEMVGKEVKRQFGLQIEVKDEKADDFQWTGEDYTGLSWYYTCQPKMNPQLGGQQGQMKFGGQQQPPAPKLPVQAQPVDPLPTPAKKIQAQPVDPSPAPARKIQAQPVDPSPTPARKIQAQPVDPSPAPVLNVKPQDPEPATLPKRAQ